MNFGTNLATARRLKGISQEELAELLCVSRQTIYKWEAGITYPDVDKLCDIARCLDVSTAYLLGEGASQEACDAPVCEPAEEKKEVHFLDKASTVRYFKGFANVIAICTMVILFAVASFVCIGGLGGDGAAVWGLIPLLGLIFAAVIGYVIAGIRHDQYLKENDGELLFEKEEMKAEQRAFTVKIVVGLALIFVGVLFVVLAGIWDTDRLGVISVTTLLALIGVACYFFITAGIMHDLYLGEEGPRKHHEKKKEPAEAACGIIMMLATAAFLVMGFVWDLWHPAWVVFPLGGLLCGAVSIIFGNGEKRE